VKAVRRNKSDWLWGKGFVKEMSFKSEVEGREVIGDESECGDCDEVMCARGGEPGGQ